MVKRTSALLKLPNEMIIIIGEYIQNIEDLFAMMSTCRHFLEVLRRYCLVKALKTDPKRAEYMFLWSCISGAEFVTSTLLSHNVDCNTKAWWRFNNKMKRTGALELAIRHGNTSVVKLLLQCSSLRIDYLCESQCQLLKRAVNGGNTEIAELLLSNALSIQTSKTWVGLLHPPKHCAVGRDLKIY